MFIVRNGFAYAIKGKSKKAQKIKFNYDMTYSFADEIIDVISKDKVYTLNEVIAKLNIKEKLQKHLIQKATSNSEEFENVKKELDEAKELINNLMKDLSEKEQLIKELEEKQVKKEEKPTQENVEKNNK